jgi:hypothetical protein
LVNYGFVQLIQRFPPKERKREENARKRERNVIQRENYYEKEHHVCDE